MRECDFLKKLLDRMEVEWQPLEQVAKIKHGKDWKGFLVPTLPRGNAYGAEQAANGNGRTRFPRRSMGTSSRWSVGTRNAGAWVRGNNNE